MKTEWIIDKVTFLWFYKRWDLYLVDGDRQFFLGSFKDPEILNLFLDNVKWDAIRRRCKL